MAGFWRSLGCLWFAALLAACDNAPTQRVERAEFVVSGSVRSAFDDSPIVGAVLTLTREGEAGCVPVMAGLEPSWVRLAAMTGGVARRFGPICVPIATAGTRPDGSYEMLVEVEYEPGRCDHGLRLEASAPGYQRVVRGGVDCTIQTQVFDFTLAPADLDPPHLFTPTAGFAVPQNQGLSACPSGSSAGTGYTIAFDWSDVMQTLSSPMYRIMLERTGSSEPLIDELVSSSEFVLQSCDFIGDADRLGWFWRVRAETPQQISPWSELRSILFEPCRLSDHSPCSAPSTSSVASPEKEA